MSAANVYVERAPVPALAPYVTTVWYQRAEAPVVQRDLPHGGAELRCVIGSGAEIAGPRTIAHVAELAPGTAVAGVRFRPGGASALLGLPASEFTDLRLPASAVLGAPGAELGERIAAGVAPLATLQGVLVDRLTDADAPDPLIAAVVDRLMPGQPGGVREVSRALFISERQLRRRCESAVGIAPKPLQLTLRFQAFLALAQRSIVQGGAPGDRGLAALAADVGYADQPHLTRECMRLTGTSPAVLLGAAEEHCPCGHDHAASYAPLLRRMARSGPAAA